MVNEQATAVNYSLQDIIYRQIQDNPQWRGYLTEMVDYESAHRHDQYYMGWEWDDVHTPPSTINRMLTVGIVDKGYKSRSSRSYNLRSLEDTKAALGMMEVSESELVEPVDVEALFGMVVGHDRIKQLVRYALKAESAVHCLMIGPPGTAKTLMLSDIAHLPGAQMYLGSTTTKAGLVGMLLTYRPTYLIIDEIDKMDGADMSPLLSLMETGVVSRLQHGHYDRVSLPTRVFAGANDVSRLSAPILNRFARFQIPAYTRSEFLEVCQRLLAGRENLGPAMSLLVANEVSRHSLDIRDAVRVARMSNGHPIRVKEIVEALWPSTGHSRITPMRKDG